MELAMVTGKRGDGREFTRILVRPAGTKDFYYLFPTATSQSMQAEAKLERPAGFVQRGLEEFLASKDAPLDRGKARPKTGRRG